MLGAELADKLTEAAERCAMRSTHYEEQGEPQMARVALQSSLDLLLFAELIEAVHADDEIVEDG